VIRNQDNWILIKNSWFLKWQWVGINLELIWVVGLDTRSRLLGCDWVYILNCMLFNIMGWLVDDIIRGYLRIHLVNPTRIVPFISASFCPKIGSILQKYSILANFRILGRYSRYSQQNRSNNHLDIAIRYQVYT